MDAAGVVAIATAGIGAAIDLRSGRIPNFLTFGAAAAALLYGTWHGGLAGAGHSAAGWGVGVALFLPIFLLGGLGAGDVKLLGAVGAWVGPMGALWTGLYSVFAGGLLALIVGASRGYLGTAFRNVRALVGFWRTSGIRPAPGLTLADSAGPKLAYGVAIAVGTVAAVWWRL